MPDKNKKLSRTVYIKQDTYDALMKVAEKQDRTFTWVASRLLDACVELNTTSSMLQEMHQRKRKEAKQ